MYIKPFGIFFYTKEYCSYSEHKNVWQFYVLKSKLYLAHTHFFNLEIYHQIETDFFKTKMRNI